jgi:hypothetical protein
MLSQPNNPNKLAFSSSCIPGSEAEQKEKERLAEFKRAKALRKEAEERDRPQIEAQRQAEYLANWQANQNRLQRDRAARAGRSKVILP